MNQPLVIREATAEDAGELTRLYRQLEDGSTERPIDEQTVARVFARTRDYPGYRVLLAVEGGKGRGIVRAGDSGDARFAMRSGGDRGGRGGRYVGPGNGNRPSHDGVRHG